MPDLIESTSSVGIDAMVGFLQRQRSHIADEGRKLARGLHGANDDPRQQWRRLCQEVQAGRAEAVHTRRESFLTLVRARLKVLRHVDELARLDGREPQGAEDLADEIADLEKLHSRLSSRWRDTESLQYLAAETLTPSPDKLDAIARKNGFPQAWYDQDDDPFQE
jgi:hypothetical protein